MIEHIRTMIGWWYQLLMFCARGGLDDDSSNL